MIKIAAILGSVRPNNSTAKALNIVADEFRIQKEVALEIIDPGKMELSLPGMRGSSEDTKKLRDTISKTTGVVLSTPEYHGSYSSVIKLVIDNLGFPSPLKGKPVTLLGVAAGQIGAVKALEHLRSVCSHVGALVLPGPVSLANVHKLFDEEGRCTDEKIEKRIRTVATNLLDYIHNHICPKFALEDFVRQQTGE